MNLKRSWKQRFIAAVVARHGPPLLRFFVSRLPNASDAPDLVQEVYLRILRLERPDLIRTPEAYLFTIASNIAREHALKRSRHPPHIAIEEDAADELTADVGDFASAAPEELVVQRERIRRIQQVMEGLSPKARATLIWHRRDGHTYEEIAARLGVSCSMVKKYLSQALAHCRQRMDKDEGGWDGTP